MMGSPKGKLDRSLVFILSTLLPAPPVVQEFSSMMNSRPVKRIKASCRRLVCSCVGSCVRGLLQVVGQGVCYLQSFLT